HAVGLTVGDHPVAVRAGRLVPELGANATGVHPTDDLLALDVAVILQVPLRGHGEHVAGRGVARAVLALGAGLVAAPVAGLAPSVAALGHARVPGGGDVAAAGADRGGAGLPAVLERLLGDRGGLVEDGIAGGGLEIGVSSGDQLE